MGTPWRKQKLGMSLKDFQVKILGIIFRYIAKGEKFNIKDTDHNSQKYREMGISNKQIVIAGGMLYPEAKSSKECMEAFIQSVIDLIKDHVVI